MGCLDTMAKINSFIFNVLSQAKSSYVVYMLTASESNVCKMADTELNLRYLYFTFGSLVAFALMLYWCGTYRFSVLKTLGIPGPKPWPFLGNILEVHKFGGLHAMLLENMKRYGKIFTVCLGRLPTIVITEPEVLKTILVKEFASFRNRSDEVKPPRPLNCGLLAARDDQWKRIRSILSPSYTTGKMKQMIPLMDDAVNVLMKKLDEVADAEKSVEVVELFGKLTLDVILLTAFGIKTGIQTDPQSSVTKEAQKLFRRLWLTPYLSIFPYSSLLRRTIAFFRQGLTFFVGAATEIFEERKKCTTEGRNDLIQLLLTAHDEPAAQGASKLTDDEVIAQLITFLLTGYQPSSSTLAFTAYHLAMDSDVQERLRCEVEIAIQTYHDLPLYDIVHEIEYLDCVMNESMRRCPPFHIFNRKCEETCTISPGFAIPAGMEVTVPVYALHHDPEAWPDPDVYDPERFRGPAKEARHPFQFLPFGAGPRNCIGMKYAMMEIKVALVRILRKFKFVRAPDTQEPLILHSGVTLGPRDGIHLRVKRVKSLI